MKLLIIFAISAVLLQYHFAATTGGNGAGSSKQQESSPLANIKIPPLPKSITDNYELRKKLGVGASALVVLAKHIATGKYVAIKMIDKTQQQYRDQPEFLKNEVDNLKGLEHPHIVKLYHTAETNLDLFMVMDFSSGGEVYDYIYKPARKMKEDEARDLFRQLVSAVEYLDYKKIVHRDLKPENLLMDRSKKNIMLTDFGFSDKFYPNVLMTTYCGSASYSAPEVMQRIPYNGRFANVWSLGVVLDEMLMGSVPFNGSIPLEILHNIGKGYHAPSTLSGECKDLLYRIFVLDPEKRLTIKEIMDHPWMNIGYENDPLEPHLETELSSSGKNRINELLLKRGFKQRDIDETISKADYRDELFAEYLLLGGKYPKAPRSPTISRKSISRRPTGAGKPQGA